MVQKNKNTAAVNKNYSTEILEKPWYKQGWLWFIISFPMTAVVAGLITYQIAANSPHSMVKDDYFKEGLAINQQLALLQKAETLTLNAMLSVDQQSKLLLLKLTSLSNSQIIPSTQALSLSFSHPTLEKYDQTIRLSLLSSNEFVAEIPVLPSALWHIQIHDETNQWIIKGRWLFPDTTQVSLTSIKN